MRRTPPLHFTAALLSFALPMVWCSAAGAAGITVTVGSQAGPWEYANGGLNSGYQYGINDQSAPVVINAADGFSFAAGGTFSIQYLSGLVSAGGSFPFVDANGWTGEATNGNTGSTGKYFPSRYFANSDYPAYLVALVGTFTNSSGAIVGTPFKIGDSRSATVPVGATQLQLGINDDRFNDNRGSFTVMVVGPSAVPEPSSVMLMGVGVAALVAGGRRRRARVDVLPNREITLGPGDLPSKPR